MLHNEARKLLIKAWNKTHNAKEVAECFGVNTSTVYRLEKRMRETGSVETRVSQRRAVVKMGYVYKKKSLHASEQERPRCQEQAGGVEKPYVGERRG